MLWVMSGNLCKQSDFPVLIWVPLLERIWKYNLQHMLTHLIKFVGTFKSSIFRVFKWFWSMLMKTHYSAQKIDSHWEQDAILERNTIKNYRMVKCKLHYDYAILLTENIYSWTHFKKIASSWVSFMLSKLHLPGVQALLLTDQICDSSHCQPSPGTS